MAVASAGHVQVYTSLQTDNHTSTSPLSFLQAGCPSCRPTNSVKALKALLCGVLKENGLVTSETDLHKQTTQKGKVSPYSITESRVPELILVLGSQPAGEVSHKPGSRLPLLSTRPAVTLATLKRAATNFTAW